MTEPGRPTMQHQGPATSCVIHGRALGWLSCTSYAFAMGTDQGSAGRVKLTGCDFRDATNDTAGGTTMAQNAPLAESRGVAVELHAGSNVAAPYYVAVQCRAGRGFVLQGNTGPLLSTSHRATAGSVNHAIFVSAVRGGRLGEPAEALVYDPAADGRKRAYHVDSGPSWWPWSLVLAFAAALRPWGDGDSRKLGPGKFYCALFPDQEPHVHLHFGGRRSSPFPDRTRVNRAAGQWRYRTPAYGATNRVEPKLADGDLFEAYQYVNGWAGNHDGNQWIPLSRLSHVGGKT